MSGIAYFWRSTVGVCMFITGLGMVLVGLVLVDLYGSPVPLLISFIGVPIAVFGRRRERSAKQQLTLDRITKA
jgi:hypothetical protein